MAYPKLVENLIEHLNKLPGIGRRSAERIVFKLLNNSREEVVELANAMVRLKEGLKLCTVCNNLTETEICPICSDPSRDQKMICVVEDHKHLLAIDRTGIYEGLYYVLLGPISPVEGRGPDDLKIQTLITKVKEKGITEVIIATDPDTEGEMTAIHIMNELKPTGVKISRIGLGIPMGSSVEYADLSTLTMSMASRREIAA